jgi:hypothetical protein
LFLQEPAEPVVVDLATNALMVGPYQGRRAETKWNRRTFRLRHEARILDARRAYRNGADRGKKDPFPRSARFLIKAAIG